MHWEATRTLRVDAIHLFDAPTGDLITSVGNRVCARIGDRDYRFTIPVEIGKRLFLHSRLARRALRLDKSNIVLNHARDGLVALYRGTIWFYDLVARKLSRVGAMQQCRNALHGAVAVRADGIFFGEYGSNTERKPVPVWASYDDGRSWSIVWRTPMRCKHVHGVYDDPYSDRLWIATGDFEGECFIFSADAAFAEVIAHGDGSQNWRPVSLFFTPERIVWVMDSPLETPCLQSFDRATGTLTRGRSFPGPCWYGKQLNDGWAVLQTSVEPGPAVASDHAHIFASADLAEWNEVARFRKDRWPMRWFKFGVVAFADGRQTRDDFAMFGEALVGFDGIAAFGALRDDE